MESTTKDQTPRDGVNDPTIAHGARGEDAPANEGHDEGSGSNARPSQNDDASLDDQVQEKVPPPVVLTKRQKVKRHCGKFWWWYLISLIIFLAIILPIFFKVIIPAIIQGIVNKQKLPVNGGLLQALTPSELIIAMDTSLDTPLPCKIGETGLQLYNADTKPSSPFGTLVLPEQHVSGKTSVIIPPQKVTITNLTELTEWFGNYFDREVMQLSFNGKPDVSLGALKYHPNLRQTIELPGLRHFKGFGINKMELMMTPDEKGHNVKGTLNLPNTGVLTLSFGNLTLNLFAGGIRLGIVNVYNVELKPGANKRVFDGVLYFKELIPNLATILDSEKVALSKGNIQLNVTGNATVVNGQRIPYVEGVLNKRLLSMDIPVMSLLSSVVGSVLKGDSNSLIDIFGDVFGNSTLLEHVMAHWDTGSIQGGNSTSALTKLKRAAPKLSLLRNVIRLGMRGKT